MANLIPTFKYEKITKFSDGYWGDLQTLLQNNEIDNKKIGTLLFHIPNHKIWTDNLSDAKFCLKCGSYAVDYSKYVVLGITKTDKKSFTNSEAPYCILFDVKNGSPKFSNNLVFAQIYVPVLESYYLNIDAANLCYMGNFCKPTKDIETTQNPIARAQMILQILNKFDIKQADKNEQRMLLNIKNNAATLALNAIGQKRKEVYMNDFGHFSEYKMKKDILDYYQKSQDMPLSKFLYFAEQQSIILDEKERKELNKSQEKQDDDLQKQIENYKL